MVYLCGRELDGLQLTLQVRNYIENQDYFFIIFLHVNIFNMNVIALSAHHAIYLEVIKSENDMEISQFQLVSLMKYDTFQKFLSSNHSERFAPCIASPSTRNAMIGCVSANCFVD